MADYVAGCVRVKIPDGQEHEAVEYLPPQCVCYLLSQLDKEERQANRQHRRQRVCQHEKSGVSEHRIEINISLPEVNGVYRLARQLGSDKRTKI